MILEIFIYLVAVVGALVVAGYSVHMFVGGLVSLDVEYQAIGLVCFVILCVTAYMAWDVVQKRKGGN